MATLKEEIDSLLFKFNKHKMQLEHDKRLRNLEDGLKTFRDEAFRLK